MSLHSGRFWHVLLLAALVLALAACGGNPTPTSEVSTQAPTAPEPESPATDTPAPTANLQQSTLPTSTPTPAPTPTPTPTPTPAQIPTVDTATPEAMSGCEGLSGQLEVQVLVGPADAVGLEPVAVGNVPFAVVTSDVPFLVEGQGPIDYEAELQEQWGTYHVTMDLVTAVDGECSGEAGSEQLDLLLEMMGEQMVVVDSPNFHGEYPWSGTHSLPLTFPLEEGATAEGEGWVVVLHLGSP